MLVTRRDILVRFARGYLPLKIALLIVKILQLKVELVNLLTGFSSSSLGVSRVNVCRSVETAQLRKVGIKYLGLLGDLRKDLGRW